MSINRQAMQISIKELKDLIKELEKEQHNLENQFNFKLESDKKFLINIINKTPECSDTWEFE